MGKKKLVVFTGAGVSAESGIATFRDSGGLWEGVDIMSICSPQGWSRNREMMQGFYNDRIKQASSVQPNRAHEIIAELEEHFDVTVVTQNVDNLHERAGSTKIIHLHGELSKKCSSKDKETHITDIPEGEIIKYGSKCPDGSAWRPYIVFFGEMVPKYKDGFDAVMDADLLLVVGSSLQVAPANMLVHMWTEKDYYVVDPDDYTDYVGNRIHIQEPATTGMQKFVELMKERGLIDAT